MRDLLKQYKLVITFIITFFVVYVMLTFLYNLYLTFSIGFLFYPDYITNVVALQAHALLETIGYDTLILAHPKEASIKLIVNGAYVARVIEGCNAMSVIILFISFIVAFADKLKATLLYCLSGAVIIYIFNLIRIVILAVALYYYPSHKDPLHTVLFPSLIYGVVFLLWMFWVNRFSKTIKGHA